MRVVVVNPAWAPGLRDPLATLERFSTLTGWARAVRNAGADRVTVCQRFPTHAEIDDAGVRYVFCPDAAPPSPRAFTRISSSMAATIAAASPHIVHLNGVVFPEFNRSVRNALTDATAMVVQDHGGFDPRAASALARLWIRGGLAAADAVLVSSRGQAEEFDHAGLVPAAGRLMPVMESSSDLLPMPRDRARQLTGMNGDLALLWVGRLNRNKDPLTVLRGAALWFAGHPRATLTLIYQDDELAPAVRAYVEATSSLRGRVRFIGEVAHRDLAAYYSAADLFVLGSHYEGSGYAVIEALAAGTVPVVTDIASFRALTDDGRVGALWPAGDAQGFANALTRAMMRPLEEHRGDVRQLFETSFSWAVLGRRAMEIYGDVTRARAATVAAAHRS